MLSRRRLDASQINLAMQAWRAGDAARGLELLEGQRPSAEKDDLRGFEWFYLWRLTNGGRLHLKGHTDAVLSPSYSPDAKTLASTGSDGTIRLWDTATGREKMVLRKPAPWDVVFSPDGRVLACGGKTTPKVTLWTAATGEVLHNIPAMVNDLAFSPDSQTLLGGGLSARLWDVVSAEDRGAFPQETGLMVGMLPDQKTIVTLSEMHTKRREARFWETTEGVTEFAKKRELSLPIALEASGASANIFGTRVTTTTVVIDKDGLLRYRGQFGDGQHSFALEALKAVLAGKEVPVQETRQKG